MSAWQDKLQVNPSRTEQMKGQQHWKHWGQIIPVERDNHRLAYQVTETQATES